MGQFEKPFIFYLIEPISGDYYYVDTNGDVQTTSTATPLQYAPEGWEQTEIAWERSTIYWGLARNFTQPYIFHKDAHDILIHIWSTQGIEGKCKLLIRKWDYANIGSDVTLNDFYSGDLDFSQVDLNKNGTRIQIVEGGLRDMITANSGTDYEIPFDGSEVTVYMDGQYLTNTYKWITGNFAGVTNPTGATPVALYQQPVESQIFQTGLQYDVWPDALNITGETNKMFDAAATMICNFTADFYINYSVDLGLNPGQLRINLNICDAAGATGQLDTLTPINNGFQLMWSDPNPVNPGSSGTRHVQFTYSYPMISTDCVVMVMGVVDTLTPGVVYDTANIDTLDGGFFTIQNDFRLPATKIKAWRHYQLGYKLIEKITGGAYSAQSDFLEDNTPYIFNSPYDTCITSGRALRELANDAVKTNFEKYFQDAQSQWCLGAGIVSDVFRIEPISFFLDPANEIVDIGAVADLQVSAFKEAFFNKIRSGYPDSQNNYLNGQEEPNAISTFTLPLTRVYAQLDLSSDYRYGLYDIEAGRSYLINKDSTNDKGDNDLYGIEISTDVFDGGFLPARKQNEVGNSATGILFPATAFNLAVTPLSKVYRNIPRILPALHLMNPGFTDIVFQTSERNSALVAFQATYPSVMQEGGNISMAGMLAAGFTPLFLPIVFKFRSRVPQNLIELLNSNDRGYFTFTYNGIQVKAFPLRVGIIPATKDEYTFELLCHPGMDMADVAQIIS